MTDISKPTSAISACHARWKKNRDFISGKDAVVRCGEAYLPKPVSNMDAVEYREYIKQVSFFPACVKVLEGWMGLIFRDRPELLGASASYDTIKDTITPYGDNAEELAASIVREVLITNWTGVLVDHPERPLDVQLTAANALENGFRPFVLMFPAESILDAQYGVVRNKRELTYARLLENENSVLELRLTNGTYTIEKHLRGTDGRWESQGIKTPTRNGQALPSIPFRIITTRNAKAPTPSPFEHMVDLNADIWTLEGLYTQALRYCANPIVSITGLEDSMDEDGNLQGHEFKYGPGVIWKLGGSAALDVKEFQGTGTQRLLDAINEKKSQLARTGARILQDDKAAAEATETVLIRQTSDNASLAGLVRSISRYIEQIIGITDWWLGNDAVSDIKFQLNTDYTDRKITPSDLQAALEFNLAGKLSEEELFHYMRRPNGLIDDVVSWDEHREQIERMMADRPSAGLSDRPAQTEE